MLQRIVSGGQTGVDRAALDEALELGLEIGGWCPKGRWAEDGPIPARYPLRETPTTELAVRTEWNVRDSDGTLILYRNEIFGGTALTRTLAAAYHRPCLCIDLNAEWRLEEVISWIEENRILRLNVAGPRQSNQPEVYAQSRQFIHEMLAKIGLAD